MRLAPLLLAVATAAACADLPPLLEDVPVCGNGVLEAGEDCDSFAADGFTCGEAGADEECRFTCDPEAAGGCPPAFGCGHDGICRRGHGRWVEAEGSPYYVAADLFTTGDADGDGNLDLIGYGPAGVTVKFGSRDAVFDAELDLAINFVGLPGIGDTDADGITDVVAPLDIGLVVFEGDVDRSFKSETFAPFEIPLVQAELRATEIRTGGLVADLLIAPDTFLCYMSSCDPESGLAAILPDGFTSADLADDLAVFDLDAAPILPADELAFAFTGDTRVFVYELEQVSPPTVEPRLIRPRPRERSPGVPLVLTAPAPILHGVKIADVDVDGRPDLMISIEGLTAGTDRIAIALNDGAGGFLPPAIEPFFEQIMTGCGATRQWPLAAGQIGGDARPDFVTDRSLCLWLDDFDTGVPGLAPVLAPSTAGLWAEAAIVDINGDGLPDAAASFADQDGIDFAVASGVDLIPPLDLGELLFNAVHVDTENPAGALRVGDFDGDHLQDLAFRETGPDVDTVSITYGEYLARPSVPFEVAELDGIHELVPFWLINPAILTTFDAIDDLIVLSRDTNPDGTPEFAVSMLLGHSSRQMLSPYFLGSPADQDAHVVPFLAQVGNFVAPSAPEEDFPDVFALGWEVIEGAATPAGRIGPFSIHLLVGGETGFDASLVQTLPYAEVDFAEACSIVLLADLDGDTLTELYAIDDAVIPDAARPMCELDPELGLYAGSRLAIADPGGLVDGVTIERLPIEWRRPRAIFAADLEADGFPDLVVTFGGDAGGAGSGVLVYWNRTGAPDLAAPAVITPEAGTLARGAGALNADADAELELVVMSDRDLRLYDLTGGAFATAGEPIVKADAPAQAQLLTGDVDSDGAWDIIATIGRDVRVFRAAQPDQTSSP